MPLPPLVLVLALHAAGWAHPNSLSRTRIRVEGARATVELRFQALSLIEVLPEVDPGGDAMLDAAEIEASRAVIEGYLTEHLRIAPAAGGAPLAARVVALEPQDPAELGALDLQNVDARFELEAPAPLATFEIESRLFRETNPWHSDFATVEWNDDGPAHHTFQGPDTRWTFEPSHVRRPGVLALFLRLGVEHILAGFDHQAFLLALLVASRRVRSLVGVVTAFTLAHSVTLALAALDVVHLPSRFVELAIALSIAYVACDNLLRREARDPWLEAFGFGLLHGLGFAGFLGDSLAGEPLIVTALLGFNLGVELGQLALIGASLLVLLVAFRGARRPAEGEGLVPRRVRAVVSGAVAVAGFYWFLERAGWLPWA